MVLLSFDYRNRRNNARMKLTGYEDFEGVLIEVAAEQGWSFCDGAEPVAHETVFNEQTFGPAILKLAADELAGRGFDVALGVNFTVDPEALLGVSAGFDDALNSLKAACWRICMASYVVEQLPRSGADFDLALLREVFVQQPAPAGASA